MRVYETPGVYYERPDSSGGGVNPLRMDIPAFVGICERGPVGLPVPVESFRQFNAHFGGFTGAGYLAYVVRAFFDNGGRRCWIVRVGTEATNAAFLALAVGGTPAWRVEASSPGSWGNELQVRVRELRRQQTRSVASGPSRDSLIVLSTAGFERGDLVEIRQGASVVQRALAGVEQSEKRLVFVSERPAAQRPYHLALPLAIDPTAEARVESVSYGVEVFQAGRLIRAYDELSVVPDHPRYGPRLLPPLIEQLGIAAGALLPSTAPPALDAPFQQGRGGGAPSPEPISVLPLEDASAPGWLPASLELPLPGGALEFRRQLQGGADGLALLDYRDFLGEESVAGSWSERRGLAALASVREISAIAIPDVHIVPRDVPRFVPPVPCEPDPCLPSPPPLAASIPRALGDLPPRFADEQVFLVQQALVEHCERHGDRVALLDPPLSTAGHPRLGGDGIRRWRARFESSYAALYFPWLDVVDPLRATRQPTLRIPPCGHVAGQMAASDLRAGVHQAPANVALCWVQDVSFGVDEALHGELNPRGVNAIRALAGRGIRVFGARTVSSDTDLRFLNVRRLLIMIRKSLDAALQWAVFEPNDDLTRLKLALSVRGFLRALWEQGALAGALAEQAFFVRCDQSNNPATARDRGELVMDVGVAPTLPFEFVVLRVGRDHNGFEVSESTSQGATAWPS